MHDPDEDCTCDVAGVQSIGGGARRDVVAALRDFADRLEDGDDVPTGYVVAVVRSDGGVLMRWAGAELPTIGALEYAKHTITALWRRDGERER